jgi:predicted metal-dependent enzyme (double-stranded beta helix superfamily)
VRELQPALAVRDLLDRTLREPDAVADALARDEGGIDTLHVSDELTILDVVWAPRMRLFPHDHRMWAAIGIYGGVEDNELFRRSPEGLIRSGGSTVEVGDVLLLGDDAIHAVHNPAPGLTGAIHVYGGNFFTEPRSEWDPETLVESPYDVQHARQAFADANDAWRRDESAGD